MKKILAATVTGLVLTSVTLAYTTYQIHGTDKTASKSARAMTVDESAAAITVCPSGMAINCLLAEREISGAQHRVGVAYYNGKGAEEDMVHAPI